MNKRITRRKLRGKPLDDDCKKAITTTHEYGMNDNRVFCLGLRWEGYEDIVYCDKCKECGALIDNSKPLEASE